MTRPDPFTAHAPGRRYATRPMPLCAGEVAEVVRSVSLARWLAELAALAFVCATFGGIAYCLWILTS